MAGNEAAFFPVTSGDGTWGTTLRRYLLNGANIAAVGVDGSANSEDLVESSTGLTYSNDGYGEAVKSDGEDECVTGKNTSATSPDFLEDAAANTNHSNASNMTIELIVGVAAKAGVQWNSWASTNASDSSGWYFMSGRDNEIRFGVLGGSGDRIMATIDSDEDASSWTIGDWLYICASWDSALSGDARLKLWFGNLSSTTADVYEATDYARNVGAESGLSVVSNKMWLLESQAGSVGQVAGEKISGFRIM